MGDSMGVNLQPKVTVRKRLVVDIFLFGCRSIEISNLWLFVQAQKNPLKAGSVMEIRCRSTANQQVDEVCASGAGGAGGAGRSLRGVGVLAGIAETADRFAARAGWSRDEWRAGAAERKSSAWCRAIVTPLQFTLERSSAWTHPNRSHSQ